MGYLSGFTNFIFGAGAYNDISTGFSSTFNPPPVYNPPPRRSRRPVNNWRGTPASNPSKTANTPLWGGSSKDFGNNWTPDVTTSLGMEDFNPRSIVEAKATVNKGFYHNVASSVLKPSGTTNLMAAGASLLTGVPGAVTSLVGGFLEGANKYKSAVKTLAQYDPSGSLFPGMSKELKSFGPVPKVNISAPGLVTPTHRVHYAFSGTSGANKADVVIPGDWSQKFDTSTINGKYKQDWSNLRNYYAKNPTPVATQKQKFGALTTKYQGLYNTQIAQQQTAYNAKAKAAMQKAIADESAKRTAGVKQGKTDYAGYIQATADITSFEHTMQRMRGAGRYSGNYAAVADKSLSSLQSRKDKLYASITGNKYVSMTGEAKASVAKSKDTGPTRKTAPQQIGAISGVLTEMFSTNRLANIKRHSLLGG